MRKDSKTWPELQKTRTEIVRLVDKAGWAINCPSEGADLERRKLVEAIDHKLAALCDQWSGEVLAVVGKTEDEIVAAEITIPRRKAP